LPANQWFAFDECGIDGDFNINAKVVAIKGSKEVLVPTGGYRGHTSVVHCGNAAGESLPPFFIFEGKSIEEGLLDKAIPGSMVSCQENGYFSRDHMLEFLKRLVNWEKTTKARPLIVIFDGAECHLSLEAAEYAVANKVHLVILPSHTSHRLQVADIAIFGPFKRAFREECAKFYALHGRHILKENIAEIVSKAWIRTVTAENVIEGFRKCGIKPLDRDAGRMLFNAVKLNCSRAKEDKGKHIQRVVSLPAKLPSEISPAPPVTPVKPSSNYSSPSSPPNSLAHILTPLNNSPALNAACPCRNGDCCAGNHIKKRKRIVLNQGKACILTSDESIAHLKEKDQIEAEKKAGVALRKKQREEKKAAKLNQKQEQKAKPAKPRTPKRQKANKENIAPPAALPAEMSYSLSSVDFVTGTIRLKKSPQKSESHCQ